MKYWLLKSEPDVWSIEQQIKAGVKGAAWDGVRNYQAANNIRKMKNGSEKLSFEEVIEKEHLDFFGMTREARSNSTDKTNGRFIERDWEKFDEPAYMRRPLRCRKKIGPSDSEASRSLNNR